jgi:hypothetical protein
VSSVEILIESFAAPHNLGVDLLLDECHLLEFRLGLDRREGDRLFERHHRLQSTATQGSPGDAVGSGKLSRMTSAIPTISLPSPEW